MSYAIIRNENYKMGQLAYVYRHNERKNTNYSNKEINKNNSKKNYSFKNVNTSYQKAFNNLKEQYHLKGQIKTVSNVMCELIITSDKEFFETIGEEETKRYFKMAYNFVANYQNLGEENIISAKVHMDETTPHLHIVFVPVVHKLDKKSGKQINKIACSEFWKGRESYKKLQDSFYKCVCENGFDLERGKNIQAQHLSMEKFKQVTNYENIKYELEHKPIQQIETNNLPMVIEQNKNLIIYTNKLRKHLTKSFKAIEKVEYLQEENCKLQEENKKLKRENNKLNNFIETTFEYVSILFDFSKDRLKRLVRDYFNNYKEGGNKVEREKEK